MKRIICSELTVMFTCGPCISVVNRYEDLWGLGIKFHPFWFLRRDKTQFIVSLHCNLRTVMAPKNLAAKSAVSFIINN
jgi:hypothetical protein